MYIESEIRLFADDCVCYREIKEMEYIKKLQNDIDRLGVLARIWGYEIPTRHLQYDATGKEKEQNNQC